MTNVANKIPIPNEIAIGFKKSTWVDWLKSRGAIPRKVVSEVNITGLNLDLTASVTAFNVLSPFSLALLTKTTSNKLSFTTTPERATTPNNDKTDIGWKSIRCPKIAPTIPNGIADRIINGLNYDLSGIANKTKIVKISKQNFKNIF